MFIVNDLMIQPPAEKEPLECKDRKENVETTKKCKLCLRRVIHDKYKCPYCGSNDFIGY